MEVIENQLALKRARLEERLKELGRVLVAYSGGVDSAYLAWIAHQVLGENMMAMIADSPSLPRRQLTDALSFSKEHQIPTEVLQTDELNSPDYVKNDAMRCFHCKNELFTVMERMRGERGFQHLAYGMNVDDQGDFRPGQNAARKHEVGAPLVEAGLTKQDIRELARRAGLRVWDKPASACLSSRIAYGLPVTREILGRIEKGEEYLLGQGFRQFRVRDHGDIARLEISSDEMAKVLSPGMMATLATAFKELGFHYVTLDCEGYRSGSLNAVLPDQARHLSHAHSLS